MRTDARTHVRCAWFGVVPASAYVLVDVGSVLAWHFKLGFVGPLVMLRDALYVPWLWLGTGRWDWPYDVPIIAACYVISGWAIAEAIRLVANRKSGSGGLR